MQRKLLIISVFFLISLHTIAQNEYNIWHFGNKAGIHFNSQPPSYLFGGQLFSSESSTSICDKDGNLLFYTNGDSIWNRNNQLLKNWAPTLGNTNRMSATEGSLALPVPGDKTKYYLFMGRTAETYATEKALRYWIIDMNGDNGLGEVTSKEIPLIYNSNEAFAATVHANLFDYWIAATSPSDKKLYCIRTYNGQFTGTVQSQPITINNFQHPTDLKFSPDSRWLCGNVSYSISSNDGEIQLYPFDNNSGMISTPITIPVANNNYPARFEFSHDSRFLYITSCNENDSNFVCQFDLSSGNQTAIKASKVILYSSKVNQSAGCTLITQLQLAPDGKIYCFNDACTYLTTIDYPDKPGILCNFNFKSISLSTMKSRYGSPYFPNFWFKKDILQLGNDTIICTSDSLLLDCKLMSYGRSFKWNTGDTTSTLLIKKAGTYILTVTYAMGRIRSDTINVFSKSKFKVFIGNDTAFCHQFSHQLNAGSGFKKYNWNNGDSSMMISVNQKGIYSVKVIDSNTCPLGDTIAIDEIKKPAIILTKDTITCRYIYLSVTPQKDVKYLWNNGDTGLAVKTLSKGRYIVSAYNKFCSASDTINVKELPSPDFNLGPDITLCKPLQLQTTEAGKYLWSTGNNTPAITIQTPGIYWLKITRNNCSTSDTILVTPCNNMQFYIPDAFSPNDDGINDVFSISGINITNVQLTIYNRWGEIIATDTGTSASWNGLYKNSICPEGVYVYRVKITGYMDGRITFRNLSGTVTLLR